MIHIKDKVIDLYEVLDSVPLYCELFASVAKCPDGKYRWIITLGQDLIVTKTESGKHIRNATDTSI